MGLVCEICGNKLKYGKTWGIVTLKTKEKYHYYCSKEHAEMGQAQFNEKGYELITEETLIKAN